MAEHDAWGTESGLFTNYEGTVAESWFGTDENIDDPTRVFLFWRFIDPVNEDGERYDEWTERFTIGKGWEVADGGSRIVRSDGNTRKKVNENTDYGRIINRVMGDQGGGKEGQKYAEEFKGVLDVLAERGEPQNAKVWEGLSFKIAEHEFSFTNDEDEEITYTRNLPVAFLGVSGEGESGGSGGQSESNGSSNGKAAKAKAKAALKKLAKEHEDHGDFLDAALEIDGVADDDELMELAADDSDEGLFAQVNS